MAELVRHYLISGRVQGVGYRAFAATRARELGLSGWARNLTDGRVEILVGGSSDALARFADQLRRGPHASRVEAVVVRDQPTVPSDWPVGVDVRKDSASPCFE